MRTEAEVGGRQATKSQRIQQPQEAGRGRVDTFQDPPRGTRIAITLTLRSGRRISNF